MLLTSYFYRQLLTCTTVARINIVLLMMVFATFENRLPCNFEKAHSFYNVFVSIICYIAFTYANKRAKEGVKAVFITLAVF